MKTAVEEFANGKFKIIEGKREEKEPEMPSVPVIPVTDDMEF